MFSRDFSVYKSFCSFPCFDSCAFDRYAYSEDASDEFDKDDTLMLIKPSPLPSVDIRNPEVKQVHGGNGLSTGDLEEDKTE